MNACYQFFCFVFFLIIFLLCNGFFKLLVGGRNEVSWCLSCHWFEESYSCVCVCVCLWGFLLENYFVMIIFQHCFASNSFDSLWFSVASCWLVVIFSALFFVFTAVSFRFYLQFFKSAAAKAVLSSFVLGKSATKHQLPQFPGHYCACTPNSILNYKFNWKYCTQMRNTNSKTFPK